MKEANDIPQKFGERLKELRQAAGLMQKGLASKAKISQPHLSKIESSQVEPSPEQLQALAKALGHNLWTLVGGTQLSKSDPAATLVTVDSAPGVSWLAYFASSLTGLGPEERQEVFRVADVVRGVCESMNTFLYEPRKFTDPELHKNLTPWQVYSTDRNQVSKSHVMVLFGDHPSFGAGQEIEIATAAGIPVVVVAHDLERISRMVRGAYARIQLIEFFDDANLKSELSTTLKEIFGELAGRVHIDGSQLGQRVQELRLRKSLSIKTMAHILGVRDHALKELESTREDSFGNPSLYFLQRLAHVLDTSISYLVDGIATPENADPILIESKASLRAFAKSDGVLYCEAEELWGSYVNDYKNSLNNIIAARRMSLTESDWRGRYQELKNPQPKQHQLFDEDD